MTISTLLGSGLIVAAIGSVAVVSQRLEAPTPLATPTAAAHEKSVFSTTPPEAAVAEPYVVQAPHVYAQAAPSYMQEASWERFAQNFPR
jgi:hypothetical protein